MLCTKRGEFTIKFVHRHYLKFNGIAIELEISIQLGPKHDRIVLCHDSFEDEDFMYLILNNG